MASIWDNVVASASKAATQAGEATQVAATKAKLRADLLVIDRDIHARQEKFGVEMYAHLEGITTTQEFYVADDRLINVIRPTLIKAQREVAAYERKRDTMKGKVNTAEANRSGTASIFGAASIGEKIMNAAKFAAAGAKEAATKTELAMLDRQILGFKEEFGVEMYPIFESMEDNEGWLPTDRKVRSLYDSAREDIAKMVKAQGEKKEQIKNLDGVEGSGLTPPTIPTNTTAVNTPNLAVSAPPMAVATPVQSQPSMGQTMPWASTTAAAAAAPAVAKSAETNTNGYGSSSSTPNWFTPEQQAQLKQQSAPNSGGFSSIQTNQADYNTPAQQYAANPTSMQPQQQSTIQSTQQQNNNFGGADPFAVIAGSSNNAANTNATFGAPQQNNAFDPFSGTTNNNQQAGGNQALSDADMNLFKF